MKVTHLAVADAVLTICPIIHSGGRKLGKELAIQPIMVETTTPKGKPKTLKLGGLSTTPKLVHGETDRVYADGTVESFPHKLHWHQREPSQGHWRLVAVTFSAKAERRWGHTYTPVRVYVSSWEAERQPDDLPLDSMTKIGELHSL